MKVGDQIEADIVEMKPNPMDESEIIEITETKRFTVAHVNRLGTKVWANRANRQGTIYSLKLNVADCTVVVEA